MPETLKFLPAGSNSFIIELVDLEASIGLYDALTVACVAGVVELVPGARTVHVTFDPLLVSRDHLYAEIALLQPWGRASRSGALVEIPMRYDGEDLGFVAEFLGLSVEQLIERHSEATFVVAFTGFAPGFAYMTSDDPGMNVPRRDSPRVRIPAGSVALAGSFCGVYPSASPGGWQLLGTTNLQMWDVDRDQAALLRPGDRVRFVNAEAGVQIDPPLPKLNTPPVLGRKGLRVMNSERPALYQDFGRLGNANQGVSRSGAADLRALREANDLVGNAPRSTGIEVTYGGLRLLAEIPLTIAVAGAPAPITITSPDGRVMTAPINMPISLNAGDTIALGIPASGVRTYIVLRGGFDVQSVLGSASTDTLAKVGPSPIGSGDLILPGNVTMNSVRAYPLDLLSFPKSTDTVVLDVVLGPRTDWFTADAVSLFTDQAWVVTSESNRVGVRLQGALPLRRQVDDELPSEGTSRGSIQVPRDGQPLLFLADHPLTGGYPVIAVVAEHHLWLAAQLPIGSRVRFNPIADFDPQVKEFDQ